MCPGITTYAQRVEKQISCVLRRAPRRTTRASGRGPGMHNDDSRKTSASALARLVVTQGAFFDVAPAGLGVNDLHCRPGYSPVLSAARGDFRGVSARPSEYLRACHPLPHRANWLGHVTAAEL